ncbi:MAG: efflux RND transporter periplasmic adaptor subunit [Eubacterium sp.]|nr:efflux RND transporter periplasmic adaptor subunit [Eubacterium sp.]
MKKKRKGLIISIVVLLIAAVTCGVIFIPKLFGNSDNTKAMRVKTNTVALEKTDLTESVSATGTIESAKTTTVSADLQNITIKKVLVEVGDTVKKGQALVVFDKTELKEALMEAKENYAEVEASTSTQVAQAYSQLSETGSVYTSSTANTSQSAEAAKGSPASSGSAVTMQISETNSTSGTYAPSSQSTNSLSSARQALAQAQSSKKSQLREAKKQIKEAKKALKAAKLTATMDGTVTALGVQKGDTYNGGDAVEISDLTSFQVSTTVDEYDINKIEKGQRVVILTDATGDEEIEGEITYVALTTGSSSLSGNSGSAGSGMDGGATGSSSSSGSGYEVIIKLSKTDANIRSGMTAKCSIIIKEATDVYAVPYDAITTNESGKSSITIMDSSGQTREIDVVKGMESDYYVEVTSSELSDDMSVIIPTDTPTESSSDETGSSGGLGGLLGGGSPGDMGNSSGRMPGGPGGDMQGPPGQ